MIIRATAKTFSDRRVDLKGEFSLCHFVRCTMVFDGAALPKMDGCSFVDCRWIFTDAAERTLKFLNDLHGCGADGARLVAETFAKLSSHDEPPPPADRPAGRAN